MGWQPYPAPTEEPKYVVVDAPRIYLGPPYYPQRRPVCPWPFSAVWLPSNGPSHPPPIPTPSFSLFFFRSGLGSRPTVVVGGGGGGGKVRGSYEFGASLDDDPLFRPTISSLKPFLRFRAIESSSSGLLSASMIIN